MNRRTGISALSPALPTLVALLLWGRPLGRQEYAAPGEIAEVLFQRAAVVGQLAHALAETLGRAYLVLDGAKDLRSMIHQQNIQVARLAVHHSQPFTSYAGR